MYIICELSADFKRLLESEKYKQLFADPKVGAPIEYVRSLRLTITEAVLSEDEPLSPRAISHPVNATVIQVPEWALEVLDYDDITAVLDTMPLDDLHNINAIHLAVLEAAEKKARDNDN